MDFSTYFQKQTQNWLYILMSLLIVSAVVFIASLFWGLVEFQPNFGLSDLSWQILIDLRLPRALTAMLIGAVLAISGATLQTLLGNTLAEPGMLGISGGASLAIVMGLFFFPNLFEHYQLFLAMCGAFGFTFLLVSVAHWLKLSTTRLLLVGVALGILSSALMTWAFYFSNDLNLRLLMYWLMGSTSAAQLQDLWVGLLLIPTMIWLCFQSKHLDRLMLGESMAKQLGVPIEKLRWQLILAIALLVGGAVSLGGIVSFIGLVVPHFVRIIFGYGHKFLLPVCGICGAIFLLIADLMAHHLLTSAELPLGVVTTTLGAPIFIWILLTRHD